MIFIVAVSAHVTALVGIVACGCFCYCCYYWSLVVSVIAAVFVVVASVTIFCSCIW